jgi:hypothetical protein
MAYFNFIQRLSRLTLARAEAVNALFQQIADAFGLLPDADRIKQNKVTWAENTGTANALIVTLPTPPAAYEPGFEVRVRLVADSTGPVTVDVNALGVRQVRNFFGGQLSAGDLQAGSTAIMLFDGSNFRLAAATPVALTDQQIIDAVSSVAVPVDSVNGQIGVVVLDASDVGAAPTTRTVTAGEGLTGGGDLSANRTLALTGQALALHQVNTNGLVARTGTAAFTPRTLTAGSGAVVSNGDGVSGNPTIAADLATDANIHAGTANKVISAGQIYTANAPVTSSGSGTYTINMTTGRVFQRTMTGNTTLANPTTEVAGMSGVIYFIQDATGGRTLSLSSDWKPINGTPSIDTGANKVNVFSYYVRSANNISLSYLGAE